MRNLLRLLRNFWTAEEVPRWFGLSVVLVYLFGVGTVSFLGMSNLRSESDSQSVSYSRYALGSLSMQLSHINCTDKDGPKVAGEVRSLLYDFASQLPVSSLRLVNDQRQIIASIDPDEVGTTALSPESSTSVLVQTKNYTVRCDLDGNEVHQMSTAVIASDLQDQLAGLVLADLKAEPARTETSTVSLAVDKSTSSKAMSLEAGFLVTVPDSSLFTAYAESSIVVLVLLGVLFVLHRCLRRKFKNLSLIARRLEASHDQVADTLSALKLSNEADIITASWNQLVDLTQELSEDVSRNHANEELTRALAQSGGGALSEALQALPDGLVFINEDGLLVYANAAAERIAGFKASDTEPTSVEDLNATGLGLKVVELIKRASGSSGVFTPLSETIEPDSDQNSGASSTVMEGHYKVWVLPIIKGRQDGGCLVVIRDVSQQIRADRAREEFVTQVTHELRTPLTNIRAYAETLSSGMFDDPNVVTECYNVINKETRRLSRLIEDILNVSQMEVATISLNMQPVDLNALLSESVRDVRGLADEKNIDIQLTLPAKMEPIEADRDKLTVVLNNLLGNAIKYTLADGNVVVGCQLKPGFVVVTVKDNGIGIAPEDHACIFEKFQRANDERVQAQSGTGIGLYTAREIVRRHGGEIELHSAKNEGSTFMVRLPHEANRASVLSTAKET